MWARYLRDHGKNFPSHVPVPDITSTGTGKVVCRIRPHHRKVWIGDVGGASAAREGDSLGK